MGISNLFICFGSFNGLRMLDDVKASNREAQSFLEKLGFIIVEKFEDVIVYALDRDTFLNSSSNQ